MNRRQWLGGCLTGLIGLSSTARLTALDRAIKDYAPARRGVNLAGAEFGVGRDFCNENPGRFGRDYTYNSEQSIAYFTEHGITLFRVPFRWERIQPRLGQPLDRAELDRLRQVVEWSRRHHGTLVLDVHNFGRYRLRRQGRVVDAVIDQRFEDATPVTRQHFVDLWQRLSMVFRHEPAVEAYGLMNEPHDMGLSDWKAITQAVVSAIREGSDRKLILVPGEGYSNAHRFAEVNGTEAWIKDPAGQVAYEAHCYFDRNASGEHAQTYDAEQARDKRLEYRGVERLLHFAGWCAVNGVRGFLGEFGAPGDDPRWLNVLDHFVQALDRTGMSGCYWAAGEWWPANYRLLLQPRDRFRKSAPQMSVLIKNGSSETRSHEEKRRRE